MINKQIVHFFILIIISCSLFATDDSFIICDRNVAKPIGNCLELELKLLDKINENDLPAYCGHATFCMNYDFKVIKVIKGFYTDSIITINIICPREQFDDRQLDIDSIYTHKVEFLKSYFISQNIQKTIKKEVKVYEITE